MSKISTVALMSLSTENPIRVSRDLKKDEANMFIGKLFIHMDMETLRDLCNEIAEVLDEWYEDRDRRGK